MVTDGWEVVRHFYTTTWKNEYEMLTIFGNSVSAKVKYSNYSQSEIPAGSTLIFAIGLL